MSRYIDAEWLLNFFVDIPNNFTLTIGNLRATVNDAPSLEIVRCGECKNNVDGECVVHYSGINADDFCSYGERKESE